MTGFGAGSAESEASSISIEMRSVNSRHLKLNFRLPPGGAELEAPLRDLVAGRLARGHVDIAVRIEARGADERAVELDEARIPSMLAALGELRERYGVPGEVDVNTLVALGGVVRDVRPSGAESADMDALRQVASGALGELIAMREAEGKRLEADLRGRAAVIAAHLREVEAQSPKRLERERERLRRAVSELTESVQIEEDRLAREIALIADRWDIGEEIVRAGAHLEACEDLLNAPSTEPVGKRLSFLLQELLREVNTIGSKANDASITHRVVEMKNELESLREQVENVE